MYFNSSYITKYTEHLVDENRKVVKSLRYKTLEDVNDTVLIAVLNQVNSNKEEGFYKN